MIIFTMMAFIYHINIKIQVENKCHSVLKNILVHVN